MLTISRASCHIRFAFHVRFPFDQPASQPAVINTGVVVVLAMSAFFRTRKSHARVAKFICARHVSFANPCVPRCPRLTIDLLRVHKRARLRINLIRDRRQCVATATKSF